MKETTKNSRQAVMIAILSAILYSFYPPIAKLLLHDCPPIILASLLYLGTGIGMFISLPIIKHLLPYKNQEASVKRSDFLTLLGVILSNIIAGILMNIGIQYSGAAVASLLGNFEIVATTTLAALFFREKVNRKLWIAIGIVFIASCLLSINNFNQLNLSFGALFIILATLCWGLENNFTKVLSKRNPIQVVIIKGLGVGIGSLLISLIKQEEWPTDIIIFYALVLGFISFGLSIFFYILAQRYIGAAKTSAYYAISPFISVFISIIFLKELLTIKFLIALFLMIVGSYLVTKAD